jgi:hypothetical protein
VVASGGTGVAIPSDEKSAAEPVASGAPEQSGVA